MTFRNLSILQKIGLVVFVMGLSSLVLAFVGAKGILALEQAIVSAVVHEVGDACWCADAVGRTGEVGAVEGDELGLDTVHGHGAG